MFRYIDIKIFGKNHIYGNPTCEEVYECKTPYDPEGLVSGNQKTPPALRPGLEAALPHACLFRRKQVENPHMLLLLSHASQVGGFNAVLMTYLGILAGRVLIYHKSPVARVKRLAVLGTSCLLIGACLCGFSQNDGLIPVNKNLWSTSFVLVCGGGGCWILAALYMIVDEREWWDGAPFR